MEEENVVADNSNTAEEEVLETSPEESQEETSTESDSELQAELAKARELANNYKVRAEKAERLAKSVKTPEAPKPVSGDLSTKDIYALMEAKVPEEDIQDVQEYAQLKKISVAEALKSSVVKTILADKTEQRNTALAANVGTSKRGSGKTSPDILLAKARKGELPTSDDDIERLIQARKGK